MPVSGSKLGRYADYVSGCAGSLESICQYLDQATARLPMKK